MISLVINIILCALLGITLYYCWRLDRYMKILRDSKGELAKTVESLNESTTKAQHAVAELRANAQAVVDKLQGKIEKAEFMADDLAYMIEKSNKLAENLAGHVAGRSDGKPSPKTGKAEPQGLDNDVLPPVRPGVSKAGTTPSKSSETAKSGIESIAKKITPKAKTEEPKEEIRPLSESEAELLQALKSLR